MFDRSCLVHKLFMSLFLLFFYFSLTSVLVGCGNKGDLYLPEEGSIKENKQKSELEHKKKS